MKKIFTVIFGILLCTVFGITNVYATTTQASYKDAKPVQIKTQKLKVYIPPKDILTTTMKHAFMDWQKHTEGNFSFEFVGTKSTANIVVIFIESGMTNICKNGDALGCTTYVPAKTLYGNKRILGTKIYISVNDTNGKPMTKNQVYTIMLHEIGHALGLGHSKDKKSLMYEGTNSQMAEGQEIREDDIKKLYELYGIE